MQTDMPEAVGLEERERRDDLRAGGGGSSRGSSGRGRARTGPARAAPRGTAAASPAHSRIPTATRSGPGCRRRTATIDGSTPSASSDPRAQPGRPDGRSRRSRRRPRSTAAAGRGSSMQRVERDRERQRRPGQERGPGEQADEPGPLLAPQLDEAGEGEDRGDELAGVPDAAARRDPQDLGGEAEQDRQARAGRRSRGTPIRPSSIQHSPTPAAARSALMPDSTWSAFDRPDERDERHQRRSPGTARTARRTGRR